MENWKSYARCFFKSAAATPGTIPMDTIRYLVGDTRGRINQKVLTPDDFSRFAKPRHPAGTVPLTPLPRMPVTTTLKSIGKGFGKIMTGALGSALFNNWKNKPK